MQWFLMGRRPDFLLPDNLDDDTVSGCTTYAQVNPKGGRKAWKGILSQGSTPREHLEVGFTEVKSTVLPLFLLPVELRLTIRFLSVHGAS